MSKPISPDPVTDYRSEYLPAYLSNGVIGLRLCRIPFVEGLAMLNGFAGSDPETHVESFARAPFPLAGGLQVGDGTVDRSPERAQLREQRYDFSCGELHTSFDFDGDGARAHVEVVTLCSRTDPTICMQELRLRVDRACDIAVWAGVNPIGAPGRMLVRQTQRLLSDQASVEGSLRWESHGGIGTCGSAYVTSFAGADATRAFDEDDHAALRTSYAFRAGAGRVYRLRQITSLVPDVLHPEPDVQALRLVRAAEELGFDRLRKANHAAWDEIWLGRPMLAGAPTRWQALADAAHFYLQSSVHPSSPSSTSIFGLAYWPNYHYYRGHVMWDIETFALPPLLLTSPDSARAMLEFRHRGLAAARHNAAMSGYRGAQFPWEASIREGHEAAPGDGDASAHEHHVTLDVARAFVQYLHATQDWEFGRERAWPVLRDIATWLESRVVRTRRGFEIHRVNGVAEKQDVVDNNAFVNMAAGVVAREIVGLAPRIGEALNGSLDGIAHEMFVPIDRRTHVIRNHDGYRPNEEKGETPEAAAGLFPVGYSAPEPVERATFEYYLRLADRYVGAPMLSAMLGVYAARLGDRSRALELFERGYAEFVLPPFTATDENSPKVYPDKPRAAPFAANLGGFLTSLLYGLPGLELGAGEPDSWCTRPVTLPTGWDAIEVERVTVRGRPARLTAEHGAGHATISF